MIRLGIYAILFLISILININLRFNFAVGGEFLLVPLVYLIEISYKQLKEEF